MAEVADIGDQPPPEEGTQGTKRGRPHLLRRLLEASADGLEDAVPESAPDPQGAPAARDRPALERLRTENDMLRARLSAAETVAEERGQRIEDLVAALEGLPEAWTRHLERTMDAAREERPSTVIEVLAARPAEDASDPQNAAEPAPAGSNEADLSGAEAAWREARSLRDRLERERLDRELERIRQAG